VLPVEELKVAAILSTAGPPHMLDGFGTSLLLNSILTTALLI
jgi:hypothetical protein